jgi:hypothetical protein
MPQQEIDSVSCAGKFPEKPQNEHNMGAAR